MVVDSLLKGMDEQLNSMKYNFADSFLRVVLVLCLLRFYGMESYVAILFFSTIFNAALSLRRLLKVTSLRLSLVWHVALPLGWAAGSVLRGRALLWRGRPGEPLFAAFGGDSAVRGPFRRRMALPVPGRGPLDGKKGAKKRGRHRPVPLKGNAILLGRGGARRHLRRRKPGRCSPPR